MYGNMQGWTIFAILLQCSALYWNVAAQDPKDTGSLRCSDQTVVPNFDIKKFATGRWFEQKRSINPPCKCVSVDYIEMPESKLNFSIRATCETKGKEVWNFTTAVSSVPGKFETITRTPAYTFYILDTDYDNYAIFWTCETHDLSRMVHISGLAREQHPPQAVLDKLQQKMSGYIIPGSETIYSDDQVDC